MGPRTGEKLGIRRAQTSPGSDLWQRCIDLDVPRMIPLVLSALVALAKLLVQFLHQSIKDIVRIIAFYRGNDVRSPDFNLSGRRIVVILPPLLILVQSDVNPHDPFVVTEEHREFFSDNVLHGSGEIDVHALHDDLRSSFVGIFHGGPP